MTDLEPRSPHADITHGGHRGHHWMMIACCIPILVFAIVLVVSGVADVGAIVFALACTAMMAVMMAGMGHSENT